MNKPEMLINLCLQKRIKVNDAVWLPAYRPTAGIVIDTAFRYPERPILVKYQDGEIVAPRYFDDAKVIAHNVRIKAMKSWLESEEAKQLMHDHREHCNEEDKLNLQLADNFFFALNGLNFVPGGIQDGE